MRPFRLVLTVALASTGACSADTYFSPPNVAAITISGAPSTLTVGQEVGLTVSVRLTSNKIIPSAPVRWESTNPAVATVTPAGRVRGIAAGSASVRAVFAGATQSVALTVAPAPVASVVVSPATATIAVGGTQALTGTPRDAAGATLTGRTVVWTTSDGTVATVSASGVVTAVAYTGGVTRTATITATSEGRSATATISVTPAPVASVAVSPATAAVAVGATQQLTATLRDAAGATLTGRTVTWATSNAAVATVSGSGVVTAVAPGNATITATSEGRSASGSIATANVTFATCLAAFSAGVVTSGVYTIDPDGAGGVAPYQTYCEMQADGGGWTLVLKADGNQTTFRYEAPEWTNAVVVNPSAPGLDRVQAKLQSFSTVAFTAIRLGMVEGVNPVRYLTIPIAASSLAALIGTTNTYRATNVTRTAWRSLVISPSLQPSCNREGINVPGVAHFVRIGIIANEQNDCNSPDSLLGFGVSYTYDGLTVGNGARFSAEGDRNTRAFGYIFVR